MFGAFVSAASQRGLFVAFGLALLVAQLGGCFFYDSRWGQAKASQKRVREQRMPAALRDESSATKLRRDPEEQTQVRRLRVYATPHYAGMSMDGRAAFERAVSDANPTLASDLAFRLEISDYRVWQSATNDDDLSVLLVAAEQADPAQDVDWVVVLASPREVVATSADQLGVARYLGRHLVIRAMSDAAEFDYIQARFPDLSEQETRSLYDARKRHKSATVLMHELGHTLGLPHEIDHRSLMSAVYDIHGSAFGRTSAGVAKHVLSLRDTALGTELHRQYAQSALNLLQNAPAQSYESNGLLEISKLLEQHARRPTPSAAPPRSLSLPPNGAAPATPPATALSDADRATLAQVRAAQADGDVARARTLGAPLFQKYPQDTQIQDLRCQLAMKAGLSMAEERAECSPLRKLYGL